MFVNGAPGDPALLDAVASQIGRMPAIVLWYQAWGGNYATFDPSLLQTIAARGAMPMITWEPWSPSGGLDQPAYQLSAIARGDQDAYIDTWANGIAAYGGPVYLRFAHEMNGSWYPWAAGVNGNSSVNYIAAWRHVHDRFAAAGATNVRWVWSPNVVFPGSTPLDSLYPGDAYVDWVGLDGYNWGTSQSWSSWQSLGDVFAPSYAELTALTAKPIIITETASSESGGDKAAWIDEGLRTHLPEWFPNVRAIVWFNQPKETDWQIDSSTTSLDTFRQIATSQLYSATLP